MDTLTNNPKFDKDGNITLNYKMDKIKIEKLIEIFTEINKGQGAYSRDPLIHAENTIDNMKELAQDGLKIMLEVLESINPKN